MLSRNSNPAVEASRGGMHPRRGVCIQPVPENDAVIPNRLQCFSVLIFHLNDFPILRRCVLGTKASEIIQPTSSTHSTPLQCVHLIAELTHYHLSFSNTPPLEEVPAGRLVSHTAPLKLASLLARPAHSVPCWKLSTSVISRSGDRP